MSYYEEYSVRDTNRTNRYRKCKLLKDRYTEEKLVETREIEEIPESNYDIFHTLASNEVGRLDLLAYRYYRNPLFWWVIAQANDIYDPINDTYAGMMLRIPTMETLYGYKGILL